MKWICGQIFWWLEHFEINIPWLTPLLVAGMTGVWPRRLAKEDDDIEKEYWYGPDGEDAAAEKDDEGETSAEDS